MLAPFLVGTVLLVALPMLMTAGMALTAYNALTPPQWVGLANLRDLMVNPLFWIAVRNSLFFIVLAVPLRMLGALGLALLLCRRRAAPYRTAVYIPTIIPDVAYALLWLWILNPIYGPLNMLLGALGLPAPAWLVEPTTARLAIVLMALFQIGEGFVALLAGLNDIPDDFYASAQVDGASRWQQFRWITLPMLSPWLLLLSARDIALSTQSTFTPAYIMTDGGPYFATLFVPVLIFDQAFERFDLGSGSAIMLAFFLGLALLVVLVVLSFGGFGVGDE